ncbi:helix-turn-helix domain-containing protein [Pseudomonas stutzeri]|uniref:helix-turn-helix domain-containing protein n=1 Tax=Stutzerimonas stutzeri TaxID=316 RepID=UPI0021097737|nr:helix-turn-helix domain-containing protein [Stutzerimonas stutzeri]MCQ4310881.1 helix-turn-helix domain-containing protein [Stutzerimonas stutzeri]
MKKSKVPHDPLKRWEWIKWQLRSNNSSLAELARGLGVVRNAMNNVKRQPYPRMERAIAKALGLRPIDIWPDRWVDEATPKRERPSRAETSAFYAPVHEPIYAQKHNAMRELEHVSKSRKED